MTKEERDLQRKRLMAYQDGILKMLSGCKQESSKEEKDGTDPV